MKLLRNRGLHEQEQHEAGQQCSKRAFGGPNLVIVGVRIDEHVRLEWSPSATCTGHGRISGLVEQLGA